MFLDAGAAFFISLIVISFFYCIAMIILRWAFYNKYQPPVGVTAYPLNERVSTVKTTNVRNMA